MSTEMESQEQTARLPEPRGELSALVLALLAQPAHTVPADAFTGALPTAAEVLAGDDDFHLALYCLYELHYRSFEGVDDSWEWEPTLLQLRARLERHFEAALRAELEPAPEPPVDVPGQLRQLLAATSGPSLSRYLETRATLEQFREILVHKSAYQLKEADPHSFAIPRLHGRAKVALVEVQFDEYGGGRAERQHSRLFANTMEALGLDGRYGAYLDVIPGHTLASVNLMSLFGLHRRLRGAIVGHLAVLEMDSTQPNRRYGNALRRLGFDEEATDFFDEHVEADAVHEALAAHDLAGALAADDPAIAADILLGARAMLLLDGMSGRRIIDSFVASDSSLLRAVDAPAPLAAR
jgi:Iron-containing redox enzyme